MKSCKHCAIAVYESEEVCPLCYAALGERQPSEVSYPTYEELLRERRPLRSLPLFLTITSIVICGYTNLFTHEAGDRIWSIIVAASVLFCFGMYHVIRIGMRHARKIYFVYGLLSGYLFVLDLASGQLFWSTDYVFPFLTLGTAFYLTILALRDRRSFSEYFGYILAVAATSLISVLLFFLGLNQNSWGAFVGVLSCLIISLGLYLFADQSLKEEVKKRFHR